VPTPVRSDANSSAERRRIALALLVSLFLHATLFLPIGDWGIGRLDETTAATPELRIELQQGSEATDENPLEPVTEEAQLAAVPLEPREAPEASEVVEPRDVPVEGLDELVVEAEPLVAAPEALAPNEPPAPPDSVVAQAASEPRGEGMPAAPEPAGDPALADEPLSVTEEVIATIAPAQERALTRRVMREANVLLASGAAQREITFDDGDRQYAAVLKRDIAADSTGIERLTVDITTEQGGERAHTSMQMKRLAFSHFTQLVDRWDPTVALHDDEIAGRFHSNSQILVAYDRKVAPRLLGKVSTARGIHIHEETGRHGWRSRRSIFIGGLETRSARIRLPAISLPGARRQALGNADVHVVRSDTRIVFRTDGSYDCVALGSRAATQRRLAADRPTYIIGVGHTELQVRGIVNGNVTVYSPELIVVQGDLMYAQGLPADGDDYLGLVSDGNIEIDRAEVTGPGDLRLHAAVYARKRFVVRNTNARGGGTLFMYGSVTAGSLSETEPRYATRLEFDPRFERVRPPGFPETDRYEIEDWDGRWKVVETLTSG
jgi:hypothetical protein